ncbi:MAG TPA: response regulator transcription factor [Fimbriimonadaceae bacterium]|nr:response regulator transcription factor [Fimbriimonadaceae bacterium]
MRVAITSAEPLFRDGLVAILESAPQVEVVGRGGTVRDTLRGANFSRDCVLVVDLTSASEGEVDYLLGAREFGGFTAVVICRDYSEAPQGFDRCVTRGSRAPELLNAVLNAGAMLAHEQRHRPAALPQETQQQAEGGQEGQPVKRGRGRPKSFTNNLPLSAREYQAGMLVAKGMSNRQIAETMGLKEQSVKNLITTISRKLQCENRVQVAHKLLRASGEQP